LTLTQYSAGSSNLKVISAAQVIENYPLSYANKST